MWQLKFRSQTWLITSNSFSSSNCTLTTLATFLRSLSTSALATWGNFQFLTLPPRLFMHPATWVELVAWSTSTTAHAPCGETSIHTMIACLLSLTQMILGCWAWMWLVSLHFSLSDGMANIFHVQLFIGSTRLAMLLIPTLECGLFSRLLQLINRTLQLFTLMPFFVQLIPVYGSTPLYPLIKFHHVFDVFTLFYVNKYADHHALEIAA